MTRYGSRKFICALLAGASATWLVYSGHISDVVYSTVMLAAVAAYITGNVAQKAVATKAAA